MGIAVGVRFCVAEATMSPGVPLESVKVKLEQRGVGVNIHLTLGGKGRDMVHKNKRERGLYGTMAPKEQQNGYHTFQRLPRCLLLCVIFLRDDRRERCSQIE